MLENRFLSKVKVVESGCREWQSTLHRDGYGKFWFEGKQVPAHRMAYQLFRGEIPEGMLVCHTCDNKKCVNPEHLFLGTHSDNVRDMVKKFRHWGRRKLTEVEVVEIRRLIQEGGLSQAEIGNMFGVSQITISRLKLGQRHFLSSPTLINLV